MPVNVLVIRALLQFYLYYGDRFRIECPIGSGRLMNLFEVAREVAGRLARIFCATALAGGRSTEALRNSSMIRTGGTTFSSTNTSTATMAPVLAPATKLVGPE
jgi:hypothetical protein